ncbi:type II secretion system major pseudopilin GspG [Stenotrophomonas sp. UBA7606]|uniref:type II secretion system major pseudopilin GspG n=1 Tax=Stenotrophomonas sp. UBA7606 TaxID=1947559 RepID=UPI0039C94B06
MSCTMNAMAGRQQGFTLIEIMVVVGIIGILAALVVPKVMGRPDQAKVTVARGDLKAIASALEMYRLDNRRYPDTQQGLEALVQRPPSGADNWNPEGYLSKLPIDPWGKPYLYLAPGSRAAYDLWTYGADGREGGEALDADLDSRDN